MQIRERLTSKTCSLQFVWKIMMFRMVTSSFGAPSGSGVTCKEALLSMQVNFTLIVESSTTAGEDLLHHSSQRRYSQQLTCRSCSWEPRSISKANASYRLDWPIVRSLPKGTGCPGKWLSHQPWRCSKNISMWHFRTWFSRHGGVGVMVGHVDLRSLFQP